MERVTVRLDGRVLFRVGAQGADDATTRARRIESRLAILLERRATVGPAQVEAAPGDARARVIRVPGVPVLTVTESDSQDNLTSLDALARHWALTLDKELFRAAERRGSAWSPLVAETRGSAEAAFSRLLESAIAVVPRTLAALLVIGLFWLLAAMVCGVPCARSLTASSKTGRWRISSSRCRTTRSGRWG